MGAPDRVVPMRDRRALEGDHSGVVGQVPADIDGSPPRGRDMLQRPTGIRGASVSRQATCAGWYLALRCRRSRRTRDGAVLTDLRSDLETHT